VRQRILALPAPPAEEGGGQAGTKINVPVRTGTFIFVAFLGGGKNNAIINVPVRLSPFLLLRKAGVARTKGVTYEIARDVWKNLDDATREDILRRSMKAANIPEKFIDKALANVVDKAIPGLNRTGERGTPKAAQKITRVMMNNVAAGKCELISLKGIKGITAISTAGILFLVDASYAEAVDTGWETGMTLANRNDLGQTLQWLYADGTLKPGQDYFMDWRGERIMVYSQPDRTPGANTGDTHFIIALKFTAAGMVTVIAAGKVPI